MPALTVYGLMGEKVILHAYHGRIELFDVVNNFG